MFKKSQEGNRTIELLNKESVKLSQVLQKSKAESGLELLQKWHCSGSGAFFFMNMMAPALELLVFMSTAAAPEHFFFIPWLQFWRLLVFTQYFQ